MTLKYHKRDHFVLNGDELVDITTNHNINWLVIYYENDSDDF